MKMNDFFDEMFQDDEELVKEYELLKPKYMLIEELIYFRKKHNISQKNFAEKIGVKQQAISRFEKGEIDPRLSFISKILYGMNKYLKLDEEYEIFKNISPSIKERKKVDNKPFKIEIYG